MMTGDPITEALENPQDAPIFAAPGDPGPEIDDGHGGSRFERPPFPADGPVRPLGISSDISGAQKCYYLDVNGQLVGLEAGNRHGKNSMIALYGRRSDFLETNWPQWSKPLREYDKSTKTWTVIKESEIVGFDQAEASRCHIEECTSRGIFDPAGKIRGRGAHRSDKGGLVLHLGDQLLIAKERANGSFGKFEYQRPGLFGGYVYPAGAPMMRPHHEPVDESAGMAVLKQLQSWSYKRPILDAMLTLGGIGCSHLGGFVNWRPALWIVGPRGTGKSTLDGEPSAAEGFIGHLLGAGRLNSSDASAAAIRQTLKNSTIPVIIDELEPDAAGDKVKATIELARVSAGGAKGHRGGQDHQAHEFTLRSCFWFSSILQPPLQAQDRSRIVTIELKKLRDGLKKPNFFKLGAPLLGAKILRRMIDQAHRIDDTIALYADALALKGHDARGQNVFGTLLGCADVLLYDGLPDDELVAHWASMCDASQLSEISEANSEESACIQHLLTSSVQARGGDERASLGSWVGDAVAEAQPGYDAGGHRARLLQEYGLKLVQPKLLGFVDGPDGAKIARWGSESYVAGSPCYLAVAWSHQALSGLFTGTKWQGGVWRQALGRCEIVQGEHAAASIDGIKVKFNRQSLNAVLVPIAAVLDESELPASSTVPAIAAWMAKMLEGAK